MHCARCGVALSEPVTEISGDPNPIDPRDGCEGIPAGVYFVVRTDDVWNDAHLGSVVVSRADARNTVPCGIRVGCCGPTGTDGPNLACANGHVVGTEVADCWTPHFVFFDANAVAVRVEETPDDDAASGEPRRVAIHAYEPTLAPSNPWPFASWLHEVLELGEWYGDDLEALVAGTLASRTGSVVILVHGALEPERRAEWEAIRERFRAIDPDVRARRFTIVLR